MTPPSSCFFGRRYRVGPLFLAVSVLVLAGGARLAYGRLPCLLMLWMFAEVGTHRSGQSRPRRRAV